LVLPEKTINTLIEIVNIKKAAKVLEGEWGFGDTFPEYSGTTSLFYGPSGTGKTYTAEAIAYETGKTIKIVNYAQVMSMWVGGTEKALEELFKDVADSDSILLFDECDALFTTRTSVNSAIDRYANVETNVLLSLIERYNIFTILTTNFIENIDKAFYRRIRYIVEFKEPDKRYRLRLWEKMTPKRLPLKDDVDFELLANRFKFTGGDIKNAIVRAATKCAVSLEMSRAVGIKDFIEVCEEIERIKSNGINTKVGFIKD
jgi:SpoVK/Ycf46/Vps4 family AAA+-type ATPase